MTVGSAAWAAAGTGAVLGGVAVAAVAEARPGPGLREEDVGASRRGGARRRGLGRGRCSAGTGPVAAAEAGAKGSQRRPGFTTIRG